MNDVLIMAVVILVLAGLAAVIRFKPLDTQIKKIVEYKDLPRNTVLEEPLLVKDAQDKGNPVQLPSGTIITSAGAIIPPGKPHVIYMGELEEISLGTEEPSWEERLKLQDEGWTLYKPKEGREEWIAQRPALAEYRH